jgi:hypothetical protein
MSEFIRKLKDSGWAPISRAAMDDVRLSIAARGVFGWLCSRPDDHKIILNYAMRRWGISQPTWAKIRDELKKAGYLTVNKKRENGKFVWEFELTDEPKMTRGD